MAYHPWYATASTKPQTRGNIPLCGIPTPLPTEPPEDRTHVLGVKQPRDREGPLPASSTKASMILMLISTAVSLRSTDASMETPCSVKA